MIVNIDHPLPSHHKHPLRPLDKGVDVPHVVLAALPFLTDTPTGLFAVAASVAVEEALVYLDHLVLARRYKRLLGPGVVKISVQFLPQSRGALLDGLASRGH